MSIDVSKPPSDWQVSQSGGRITLEKKAASVSIATTVMALAGTVMLVVAAVSFQMAFDGKGLFDAIYSGSTLMALVPGCGILFLAHLTKNRMEGIGRYEVLDGILNVEIRFGGRREETSVTRDRVQRFSRSLETKPGKPEETTCLLNFSAVGQTGMKEELHLGSFRGEEEVAWFTRFFESWSGRPVEDVVGPATES